MSKKILLVVTGCVLLLVLGLTVRKLIVRQSSSHFLDQTQKIQIIASFYPLAEFSQQVGGELVSVHNLTPAGSEPHDFEPSPQDLVLLENAKLFVYNGAGLESWLLKLSPEVKQKVRLVNTSAEITLLQANHDQSTEAGTTSDPHVWMDPVLASKQVATIAQNLEEVDPVHAEVYKRNEANYQAQLKDLDSEFRTSLAHCQNHTIVTSHDAFEYLAKEYGLTVLSISGLSPDEEPSAQKLVAVTDFVKKNNIHYIFFESLVSPKLSQTIASEAGAQTLVFNPLEGLTETELQARKNYLSVQKENIVALKTALECE